MTESRDLRWLFIQISHELDEFNLDLKVLIVNDEETGNTEVLDDKSNVSSGLVAVLKNAVKNKKKALI